MNGAGLLADSADGVNVTSTCSYRGDLRHGQSREYFDYAQNRIKKKCSYWKDLLHGIYVVYAEDGEELEMGSYLMGNLHNRRIRFFENAINGWYVHEVNEFSHGLLHGQQLTYDRAGELLKVETYKEGRLHGIRALYDHAGCLML